MAEVLFKTGSVVELRAFRGGRTTSGYFDDHGALRETAEKLEEQGHEVYVTLNELDPALLARRANRAIQVNREPLTSDGNVRRRRWLLLDLDPARASGISATAVEKEASHRRAREVYQHLKLRGFAEPVAADSGNGHHLLYRIDLPADDGSRELVKGVLEALAFAFDDGEITLDTSVFNAARILKLYGTTARKGDDLPNYPHRRSGVLSVPEELQVVNPEFLQEVAQEKPEPPPRPGARSFDPKCNGHKEFDLARWITERGVPVKREGPWGQGYRYILEECPWHGHTDASAYIAQGAAGWIAAGCHHNSCQGYTWQHLREHFEPGAYERNSSREYAGGAPQPDDASWEEPVPLPEGLPPVQEFDPEMLPTPLKGWVADVAERMQVPLDFPAAAAITMAGSLVGRGVGVYPKRRDDWLVVPNLWGGLVGKPSTMKTPTLEAVLKPLDRLIAEAREEYESEYASYEREVSMHKAESKARERDLDAAAKEAVKSGDRVKLEEAARAAQDAGEPEEPAPRRYKTNDTTIEKLAELLAHNPRGVLVYRDELTGFLRSLDKQGRETDRSFYLEAWSGTGSFEADRIGRGSLYVPALCVSVLGGIQPGPLSSYVWEATRGSEGSDGLLQRFQLLVWPDPSKTWTNVDRYPDTTAKNTAFEVFRRLDALTPEEFGATSEDEGAIPAVRFTREAQEEFDAFREALERRLRAGELSDALEAHLAKYRSLFPALALVFAAMDYVDGSGPSGTVSRECALRAWAWCEYLESHARRLYASAEDPAMEGARALLEKARAGDVADGASGREVYRRQWSRLTTPEEFTAAASVLEAYGWIKVETVKTGGRSTTKLHLHPDLGGGA